MNSHTVCPVCDLKKRIMWFGSEKWSEKATSLTDKPENNKRLLISSAIRYLIIFDTVVPNYSLTFLFRQILLTPVISA